MSGTTTRTQLRFGIQLPHYGPAVERIGIRRMAEMIVEAGFGGIWLSDHVVLVEGAESRYPYSADGSFGFPPDTDWYEFVTTLSYLAAVTDGVELGTAVCVLPQRQPLLLAKQLATADRLAGGRVVLGVGAGWQYEEFAALGQPFQGRGPRTNAYIEALRQCWSGHPQAGQYGEQTIPAGVQCRPTPPNGTIPILVGGNSSAALDRVARHGDGWLGAAPLAGMTREQLRELVADLHHACEQHHRDPTDLELALRIAPPPTSLGTPELADLLDGYAGEGITRFTFDFGWRDEAAAAARLSALAATTADVRERAEFRANSRLKDL